MIPQGKGWRRGINWEFGIDLYTTTKFKMDKQQGPTV